MTGLLALLKDPHATVRFTSQISDITPDNDLRFGSLGVITVRHGNIGRTIDGPKWRGSHRAGGRAARRTPGDGLDVSPKLTPVAYRCGFTLKAVSSSGSEIDKILGGGIEHGTITIICGPAGVDKPMIGAQFMN